MGGQRRAGEADSRHKALAFLGLCGCAPDRGQPDGSAPGSRQCLAALPGAGALRAQLQAGRLAAASEDAVDAAISAVVMAARVQELQALPAAPGYALEGKIWRPRDPVALGTGGRLPHGAYGELATAVATVIREAAARGEAATAQAEQVLDMLNRRGLLGGRADRPLG